MVVAALALVLAALALAVGLSARGRGTDETVRAVAVALGVALPVAAGLFALRREQTARFGTLLVLGGLAWAPISLAGSPHSVPYSIGRVWAWGVVVWVIYLLLAFPLGRLAGGIDRWLVRAALACAVVLYLPTALVAQFPLPSPWSACDTHCPSNAFMVVDHTPAAVHPIATVRDAIMAFLFVLGTLVVLVRWVRGSRIVRRVYGPVLLLAAIEFAAAAIFLWLRVFASDGRTSDALGLVLLLTTPALVVAFAAGLVRWRLIAMHAWRRLIPGANSDVSAARLRDTLSEAIRDPSLEIAYWDGAERRWIDEDGLPFPMPPHDSVRALTELRAGGRPVALLVHADSRLAGAAVRDVVQGVALMALQNQRVQAESRAALRELRDSRARIVAAIDRDRLRLERDLHDGAQQRLIALKVTADHGADAAAAGPDQVATLLRRIAADAKAALDDVRALARGVYPSLLVDHGLATALEDSAKRTSIPTEVRHQHVGRYPQEIEAAVYFCCLEALQNADKHSHATQITVDIREDDRLRFEVRDNGTGFDGSNRPGGVGLTNMRDRIAAVGGRLRIDSAPGGGTRVAGQVRILPDRVPEEVEHLVVRAADALEDAMGIYRAVRTGSGTIVDFSVEHVNDAACKLSGLPREAQVGRTLGQLRPDYPRSSSFSWHCEALEADAPLVREELEYTGTAGDRRLRTAYEVRAAALGAGRLALVWRDVTARKRVEDQLRLRAEGLGRERDGVCIVRAATGAIVYANDYLEQMFSYARGELEGRPASVLDWLETESPSEDATPRQSAPDRFTAKCRRKDGSAVFCEVTIDGFDDPDLGWCWVAAHHDVTASLVAEERTRREREQLRGALRTLPALGWSCDLELRSTLLFDNLFEPGRSGLPASGDDVDLFGPVLGPEVSELNRRVVVTRRAAEVVVEAERDDSRALALVLTAEPVTDADGQLSAVAGSALRRPAAPPRARAGQQSGVARHPRARRARE